tara:strand:- start:1775 stop:2407 length:633 start_codon:yes stop_codon:yes gene_type:complete
MKKELVNLLEFGLRELNLTVDVHQTKLLLEYLQILLKWNNAYNLTAVRDPKAMMTSHILDSLSIAPYIQGKSVLDVGTGAGLPGVPLAICYPDHKFTLLDSNGKKIRFIFQVKTQLGLNNLTEIQSRAEKYQPKKLFDAVISRAFASLSDMAKTTNHLLSEGGRFYAMKGALPTQELSMLPKHYKVIGSHELFVPGIENVRHLIEIESSN